MLGGFVMTLSGSLLPYAAAQTQTPIASLGEGFTSGNAIVNGTSIHYVRGGSGPAILLIHGFPEDWYEFHHVMPVLAKKFTVIAVDLRGVGESAPASGGFEAANLAEDLHQLVEQLELNKIYVVGHDVGGMVAYAYLRKYPEALRGAMILDVAIPGLEPWDKVKNDSTVWHIRFHQTDLPEKLVAGRQTDYFRYFLGTKFFSDADCRALRERLSRSRPLEIRFRVLQGLPRERNLQWPAHWTRRAARGLRRR